MKGKAFLGALAIFTVISCGTATTAEPENPAVDGIRQDEADLIVTESENLDYKSFKVTFIELGADRCIPCKAMQPIMREIAKQYQGVIQVVFFDIWKDPEPARRFGIQMIPTQVFLDSQGNEIARHVGFYAKEDLIGMLKAKGII